ncbi:MAG TPA: hypothetical protein VFT64_00985 [Rickettsiales bacterium]|nr:hypothetical protein [Rickettsiales bacterium]
MNINAIGGTPAINSTSNTNQLQSDDSFAAMLNQLGSVDTSSANQQSPAVQNFLNYMKESPEERFIDSWLAAHHLSREELAKMPPEKREAIMKQIEQEMKDSIKRKVEEKSALNISA